MASKKKTASSSQCSSNKFGTNEPQNFYEKLPPHLRKSAPNPDFENHHIKIPFRGIIVGACGAGKTGLLFEFLSRCPRTFSKIVLCVKTAAEPLYQSLIETTDPDLLDVYEGGEIPSLDEYKKQEGNTLVVFDDLVTLSAKQQIPIGEFYIRARKVGEHGCSCVYLTQSYYQVPKIIRIQANYIFIKKLSSTNDLNLILRDCSLGISKEQLYQKYSAATRGKWDFMLVDLEADPEERFRRNFLEII
jgi:hypothetical protein